MSVIPRFYCWNLVGTTWLRTSAENWPILRSTSSMFRADKIPRKGGPGITQSDLLVINKTDLAELVGADLSVMKRDALKMRAGGPFVFARVKHGDGVGEIAHHVLHSWHHAAGTAHEHTAPD